jgi:hypothetical protein
MSSPRQYIMIECFPILDGGYTVHSGFNQIIVFSLSPHASSSRWDLPYHIAQTFPRFARIVFTNSIRFSRSKSWYIRQFSGRHFFSSILGAHNLLIRIYYSYLIPAPHQGAQQTVADLAIAAAGNLDSFAQTRLPRTLPANRYKLMFARIKEVTNASDPTIITRQVVVYPTLRQPSS